MHRKPGQGGDIDHQARDLRAELEAAEAAHFAKVKGIPAASEPTPAQAKRPLGLTSGDDDLDEGAEEAKRRRILEETRDIDADDSDSGSGGENDDDDDDDSDSDEDSDDEEAELQRELERVRKERAEKREREVRDYCSLSFILFPWLSDAD